MKDWVADVVDLVERFPVVIDLDHVTLAVLGEHADARFQLPAGMSPRQSREMRARMREGPGRPPDLRTREGRAWKRERDRGLRSEH